MKNNFIKHNMPVILSVIGGIGVIATAVMSSKAAVEANEAIKNAEKESEEKLTNSDKVKIATPIYIPTILLGTGTLFCILSSSLLNQKNQASLTSAYMILNQTYKEYRNKVVELHGREMDDEIMDAIRIDHAEGRYFHCDSGFGFDCCINDFENMGEKVLFYDEISDRYFEKAPVDVVLAEYHLNRNLNYFGEIDLNTFYDFLGLSKTDNGDDLIWIPTDYYTWIDFSHPRKHLKDGTTYYMIHMPYEPLPREVLDEYYCN